MNWAIIKVLRFVLDLNSLSKLKNWATPVGYLIVLFQYLVVFTVLRIGLFVSYLFEMRNWGEFIIN